MQRRRRGRPVPRDIFVFSEETAERIRQRREVPRAAILDTARRAAEAAIAENRRGRDVPRQPRGDLKSPPSPKIEVSFDEILHEQTEDVLSNLTKIISESRNELKADLKPWLMNNKIIPLKEQRVILAKQKGLDPNSPKFNPWSEEEVSKLSRQIAILEYEATKDENNNFLKCFDINNLPGNYILALIFLNEKLLSSTSATHINNGKIFICKDGVRIFIDSRKTTGAFLNPKGDRKIHANVGPNPDWVCLDPGRGDTKTPGPDWVASLIMVSDSGWPDWVLDEMDGVGSLSIKYQLNKWKSEEYSSVERLIYQHYSTMNEMIHSIEVYSLLNYILIGTLSNENAGKLIGRGGSNIAKLEESIKSQFGEEWKINVQEIQ